MQLRILDDIIRIGGAVTRLCRQIARHDAELASQVRRAWVRTAMNTGEAQHRRGAKSSNRFDDAMGEAREAHTGLRMAQAYEYAEPKLTESVLDEVDRVVATLYKLAHQAPK